MKSLFVRVGDLAMHARVGTKAASMAATPVILLHGLGISSLYMIPTAKLLAQHHPVYAPDLPGFGRSEKPPRVLGVRQLADALAAWMDAMNLERGVFVANSFGCQIIVEFALHHPERMERLVLIAPTVDRYARTARKQILRLFLDAPHEPVSLILIATFDYLRARPNRVVRTLYRALVDCPEEKLPHITVPVLVVRGERDPMVPQRWTEEVAALLPDSHLVMFPRAAHAVNYSHPKELTREILKFLRET